MSKVAEALCALVKRYYASVKSDSVECRVVLPGLTSVVAEQVHEALRDASLPSLLVVPGSMPPSQADARLRAEGLTSLRHGDMIIVTWPGELSRIQDSIIGAGGAVRNSCFSDEWPWVDDGNEYFRFGGPFLDALLNLWGASSTDRTWLADVISAIVSATRSSIARGPLLLEEILGTFSSDLYPELTTLREKFLFHAGIPRPGALLNPASWDSKSMIRDLGALGKIVGEARLEVDTRGDVMERVAEVEPNEVARPKLRAAVDGLLDGLASNAEKQHGGILTLRGCWGGSTARWSALGIERLRRLFDPAADAGNVTLTLRVQSSAGFVSPDERQAILFEGGTLSLTATYDGLPEGKFGTARVEICQGARELHRDACTKSRDTVDHALRYDEIFGTSTRRRLVRVQVRIENAIVAEQRLAVFPCGTNSPLYLVLEPSFSIYPAGELADPDSDVERVEVSAPVSVVLLVNDPGRDVSLEVDDDPVQLVADEAEPRILRAAAPLDPGGSPAGRIGLASTLETVGIELELEASDYERGDFTLERELILRLAEGSTGRIARLVPVFIGNAREPYGMLGGLNDATRARSRLARAFEAADSNGLPVVADLLGNLPEASLQVQGWIVGPEGAVAGRIRSMQPGIDVKALLAKYQDARTQVLEIISASPTSPDDRWPKYASLPVFVDRRRGTLEPALMAYLEAYSEILVFLSASQEHISWEECFFLSNLDCVVHWGADPLTARVQLIGPWHPLVVAKRFMVQAALLASARRFQSSKPARQFNRLAILLDQMNSLRWIQMLSRDGKTFDHAYVSATSDPGWLFAIGADCLGSADAEKLVSAIRHNFGLEAGVLPIAREQMASSYLKDFHNAYPTRRSITLATAPVYSGRRIVESAEAVLYDGTDASRVGRMLPGGLHFFLGDAEDIESIPVRSPPICVYSASTGSDWRKNYKDIYLLPPGRPRVARVDGQEQALARGPADLSAFYAPVRRVTIGALGIPNSLAFERDVEPPAGDTVGDAFVRALHAAGSLGGGPLCTGWTIDLPEDLDFLWNVVPGGQIDPAVLVQYVGTGFASGHARVLWDYNMSLTGAANSYFVLSQVPASVSIALNGSPVLAGQSLGLEIVRELSEVGLAIGSESLRSGTKALGVIGVVGAIRLFSGGCAATRPLTNDARSRGFLLPVDSFKEILGDGLDATADEDSRRADLIAFQLTLPELGGLRIEFSAVECKYTSYKLSDDAIAAAMEQAGRTSDRLLALADSARHPSGIPERLALLALVSFGLRLQARLDDTDLRLEGDILRHLLSGTFEASVARAGNVVVATECKGQSASWVRGKGLVVRLAPGHWPGISESSELTDVRTEISTLFRRQTAVLREAPTDDHPPSPTPPIEMTARTVDAVHVIQPEIPRQPRAEAEPVAGSRLERLKPILLGTDLESRSVTYDPQSERRPLDNYNMMISGSSGKGKTQLIKAIVSELRRQDRNVLMLDFKNDFASDRVFLALSQLDCRYVTFDGLPYNPLIPMPVTHPATGVAMLQISQHISGISSVLGKTFGLGAQQESSLKDVIRDCYRGRGLDPGGSMPYRDDAEFPDFNDVGEALRHANPLAYNRMDPLFDLGVFSSAHRRTTFEAVVRASSVIDLSQIQSDTIKNAIAKILVLSAHAYYNARPHSGVLRQFFVFDEAHRVLDSEFLVRFVRECRAYGVGILLSSQYPTDFPQEVSASLNTKIIHGNGSERERVRDIAKMLGGSVEDGIIGQMGLFDAFASSPHFDAIKFRTLSYPHYLLLLALRNTDGVRRNDLRVDGIDTERLSLAYLLDGLFSMGLVEEVGGNLRARTT
jgi:hypothetical protein